MKENDPTPIEAEHEDASQLDDPMINLPPHTDGTAEGDREIIEQNLEERGLNQENQTRPR